MGFSVIPDVQRDEHRIWDGGNVNQTHLLSLGSEMITMIHNAWKFLARSSWDLQGNLRPCFLKLLERMNLDESCMLG